MATSPGQRRHGPIFRKKLDLNGDMLLVYPDSGAYRIRMKNMLIPLHVGESVRPAPTLA
jgi:uncharacterized membrane protein (UPF0127 family)